MKIQVRSNIFETNSSSVHAITVTKDKPDYYLNYTLCHFEVGEFGWEHRTYYDFQDKASYLWTCIVNLFVSYSDSGSRFNKQNLTYRRYKKAIKQALINIGVRNDPFAISFQEEFDKNEVGYLKIGFVDHAPGKEFIESLVFNEDRLIRFLFNDKSNITTWNDNSWYLSSEEEAEAEADPYPVDGTEEERNSWCLRNKWRHFYVPEDTEWKYLKGN